MKSVFYVYAYIDPRTDTPIYIGKGQGGRDREHHRACRYKKARGYYRQWYVKLRQLLDEGIQPEIVHLIENLSEDQAWMYEKFFIHSLREFGCLYNHPEYHIFGGSATKGKSTLYKNPGKKYKGVTSKNEVIIKLEGKTKYFGVFDASETAARVYDEVIMKERGQGYLNFPEEWDGITCLRSLRESHRVIHRGPPKPTEEEIRKRKDQRNQKRRESREEAMRKEGVMGALSKRHIPGRTNGGTYKGIFEHHQSKSWGSYLSLHGDTQYLQYKKTLPEAARAYDQCAFKHYGLNCYLNFPEELGAVQCLYSQESMEP